MVLLKGSNLNIDKDRNRVRPIYLKCNALYGSQMCIVTEDRIDLAIALIDRMKNLFVGSNSRRRGLIVSDTKETIIELNNVKDVKGNGISKI